MKWLPELSIEMNRRKLFFQMQNPGERGKLDLEADLPDLSENDTLYFGGGLLK